MNIEELESVATLIKPIAKQIELLSQRINNNRSTWSGNETATRLQLIDPLLREIGWDTADPDQVQPEYSVGSRSADYVLLSEDAPIAVIEAKNLDVKIDSGNRLQAHSYVNTESIRFVIVTNGNRWELYSSALSDTKPLSVFTISSDSPFVAAIEAAKISRDVLIETSGAEPSRGHNEQKFSVDVNIKDSGIRQDRGTNEVVEGEIERGGPVKPDLSHEWLTLDGFGFRPHDPAPKGRLEFPGQNSEDAVDIKTYKDLWIQVVEWLWRTESQDRWGRYFDRYVGRSASELPGTSSPYELSNELWIRTNYSTKANGKNIKGALHHFGIDLRSVRVYFRDKGQDQGAPTTFDGNRVDRSNESRLMTDPIPSNVRYDSLPHTEYGPALLRALRENGGWARRPEAHNRVREILRHRFGTKDLQKRSSDGLFNWQYRTDWVKAKLVIDGFVDRLAPRGMWRLTDEGRRQADATLK